MKKIFTVISVVFLLVIVLFPRQSYAQAPDKMSYQAVIRDANSFLVTNSNIGMQISILQGSASGTEVYVERHFPATNNNGLVTLEIGTGVIVSGDFANINWGEGPYFIKSETDLNGGANYTISGTSQILSVPYALHAKVADNVINPIPPNAISDADEDTKIQVEASPDDDIIRFDLAGYEYFRMEYGRLEFDNVGNNVFIGDKAGFFDDLSVNCNIAVGMQALTNNTSGEWNTAVGHQALLTNTTSTRNSAFGYQALRNNTGGYRNTAIGCEALHFNTDGIFNTAIGYRALFNNISADNNTAVGYEALIFNDSGAWNTAIGRQALGSNISGQRNTASGYKTLNYSTTGSYNTADGYAALYDNATGEANTALGYAALADNISGDGNTAIGFHADVGITNLTNATAIGRRAFVEQSNALVLGSINGVNGSTSDVNVGVGTTSPDESAILDLNSTSRGFLPPRMTTTQRDAINDPIDGLMIFNTTTNRLNIYIAGTWNEISLTSSPPPPGWDTVYNPATGRYWMDRNLGADQVATSSNDPAAYGDLYQWGRFSDGHQIRTSNITSTLATTPEANAGNDWDGMFILADTYPHDWLITQTDTLWQGVIGYNNPCPAGFRLPTDTEWLEEMGTWATPDAAGAYNSILKLPVPGHRHRNDGEILVSGIKGYYWSCDVNGVYANGLKIIPESVFISNFDRAFGFSVRCIKDE